MSCELLTSRGAISRGSQGTGTTELKIPSDEEGTQCSGQEPRGEPHVIAPRCCGAASRCKKMRVVYRLLRTYTVQRKDLVSVSGHPCPGGSERQRYCRVLRAKCSRHIDAPKHDDHLQAGVAEVEEFVGFHMCFGWEWSTCREARRLHFTLPGINSGPRKTRQSESVQQFQGEADGSLQPHPRRTKGVKFQPQESGRHTP